MNAFKQIVALVLSLLPVTSVVAEESAEAVFQRLRGDWARLETGFQYDIEIVERTLATAKVDRKADGRPGSLIRLTPVSPREVRYRAKVSILNDTILMQLFQGDEHVRSIELVGREIRELDDQGRLLAGMKSLGSFDDPFGVPFFAPQKTLREWGTFPWPAVLSDRRMRFTIEGDLPLTESAPIVTVRASYAPSPNDATQAAGLTRRITFGRVEILGWLPVRLERAGAEDKEVTSVEEITWTSILLPSGPVAVPTKYELQERALDPESGRYVAVRDSRYQISPASMVLRNSNNAMDASWTQLGGVRHPVPASEKDPQSPPSVSRVYLLTFAACVALAVLLLYVRHRQTARARN